MTLQQFFNLTTLEHRDLFLSYAAILLLHGGYFAWLLRGSARLRRK